MDGELYINERLSIPNAELEYAASRSGGPGGQNVQKTSSRVTIRWNISQSPSLDEHMRTRLLHRLANRLVGEGEIILHVDSERSQLQNKMIARERLAEVIKRALHIEKKRIKTKPHPGAKARRLAAKKQHGEIKKQRRQSGHE